MDEKIRELLKDWMLATKDWKPEGDLCRMLDDLWTRTAGVLDEVQDGGVA
jgi:hypothetical protein